MYKRNYSILSEKYNEFFFSALLMSITMNVSTIVDSIIIGVILGPTNLAAMALINPLFVFFAVLNRLIAFGGSILVSTSKAERKEEQANMYFTMSTLMMLIIGVIISLLSIIIINNLSGVLKIDASLLELFKNFATIFLLASPLLLILFGMPFFMRVDNRPRLAIIVVVVLNIVNIIMDLVYIVIFKMGIAGSALAFVTGTIAGLIVIIYYLTSKDTTLHFISLNKCKWSSIRDILSSGLSSAAGSFFYLIKLNLVNLFLYWITGSYGLAVFAVCTQCAHIVSIFTSGISQSMAPIVSIFYGEKDYSAVKFTIRRSLQIMIIASTGFVIIFELFPVTILNIFGIHDPAYLAVGINAVRIFSLSLIGNGVTYLMLLYTRAIQQKGLSFMIALTQNLLFMIPSLYFLSNMWGVNGIWISFLVAEAGTILMIYLATKYLSKNLKDGYSGFFLLGRNRNTPVFEVAIHSTLDEVVGLSDKLTNFLRENNVQKDTALSIGMATEEMAVNTVKHDSDKTCCIDILSKIEENEITIAFRDSGIEFNPTYSSKEEESSGNMEALQNIADNISYARIIGLNSTIITIKI